MGCPCSGSWPLVCERWTRGRRREEVCQPLPVPLEQEAKTPGNFPKTGAGSGGIQTNGLYRVGCRRCCLDAGPLASQSWISSRPSHRASQKRYANQDSDLVQTPVLPSPKRTHSIVREHIYSKRTRRSYNVRGECSTGSSAALTPSIFSLSRS